MLVSAKVSSSARAETINITAGQNGYDHISIAVNSVEETMEKIKAYPVTPINDHWFSLPDGTRDRTETSGKLESERLILFQQTFDNFFQFITDLDVLWTDFCTVVAGCTWDQRDLL